MPINFGCAAAARIKDPTMLVAALDTSRVDFCNAGRTAVFAYPVYPRFSYRLCVPPIDEAAPPPGLVVVVRHSTRAVSHAPSAAVAATFFGGVLDRTSVPAVAT